MGTLISLLCIFYYFFKLAILHTIAYALNSNSKFCRKLNEKIYKAGSRLIFIVINKYANFKLIEDTSLLNDLPNQYMIICNHQSLLDIITFMYYIKDSRLRFVAKNSLGKNIPLVSYVLKSDQHCLINRQGGPSDVMNTLDVFANRVKEKNWIPVLFPEGTRSRDGELKTFHSAGFRRLLNDTPLPVLVCAIDGCWKIASLLGILKHLKNGQCYVKALKIFPAPTTKSEQMNILDESKFLIQKQLDEWRK